MAEVQVVQSALAVYVIVGLIGVAAAAAVVVALLGAGRRLTRRGKGVRNGTLTEQRVDDQES